MRFLGVSRQVLTDLKSNGVVQTVEYGKWDFAVTVQSYLAHLREKAAGRDERTLNEDQRRAKLELTQAQARRAALIADRDAGHLLDSGQVEREWANTLRDVRAALLAVPSRVGAALPHLTAHDVETLSSEIRAALEALADGGTDGN
ncbi:DNA packaging protein [Rhodobacteraceae bacterium CCMM004]|nr:DNA packaging protein [Rhodobacteraceae bacterium CCMM004]